MTADNLSHYYRDLQRRLGLLRPVVMRNTCVLFFKGIFVVQLLISDISIFIVGSTVHIDYKY